MFHKSAFTCEFFHNLKKNWFHLIAVLAVFLVSSGVSSCGKESSQPQIPDVPVSFVINPNSTEYLNLNYIGGWEYVTGGYDGILITRTTLNDFVAFERACPYDFNKEGARIVVDTSMITCYCPVCMTKYIMVDGTPYEGPGRYPLKQYQAVYDGSLLYVSN
jgi:hypothetical protein